MFFKIRLLRLNKYCQFVFKRDFISSPTINLVYCLSFLLYLAASLYSLLTWFLAIGEDSLNYCRLSKSKNNLKYPSRLESFSPDETVQIWSNQTLTPILYRKVSVLGKCLFNPSKIWQVVGSASHSQALTSVSFGKVMVTYGSHWKIQMLYNNSLLFNDVLTALLKLFTSN